MSKPIIILEPANKGSTIIERDRINLILDRAGARGPKGDKGEQGIQGETGPKGDTGEVTQEEFDGLEQELNQHKLEYADNRIQDQFKVSKVEKELNDYKGTIANVNVNQEAKQDVSGYGVVSLPKNTANGQVSVSMKGNTEVDDEGNTKSTISASRLKSVGKNLFKSNENIVYKNLGATIEINNELITVSGTPTSYPYVTVMTIPKESLKAGIYKLSKNNVSGSNFDLTGRVMNRTLTPFTNVSNSLGDFTIEENHSELLVEVALSKDVVYNDTFYYQIEQNTVATPYEPYTESTQYLPNVGELRSVPNGVSDEIRVSGGKAELVKRVSDTMEELAEPIITPINVSGNLISYPSGTVYVENVVADAGIYTTKFDIKELQLPIKSIDKLIKYNFETGVQTVLDTSLAVINADKKSFTHPNLTNKDMVFVDYYYDVEGTLGETTIEYLDSRHTIKDSVNNKFYSWDIKSTNGVPTVELMEVL